MSKTWLLSLTREEVRIIRSALVSTLDRNELSNYDDHPDLKEYNDTIKEVLEKCEEFMSATVPNRKEKE